MEEVAEEELIKNLQRKLKLCKVKAYFRAFTVKFDKL